MKKLCVAMGVVVGCSAAMIAMAQSQVPPGNTPTVNIGPTVAAKAAAPTPSASAKNQSTQTSIGKGMTTVKASGPSGYWTDLVDIDDDGTVEDNQFLLDKQRGILYTYRYDDFKCANGTSDNGDVLMAIYTAGNSANMPAGAGWYVVGLKPGQCGEKKGGTFGCKFDAKGNLKTCGTAVIHEDSGELEVTVRKKR